MRKKVLVVEDNAELLELLAAQMRHARYEVATAANGVEALQLARQFAPDVILLDVVLPELDGFGVCEQLRMDSHTAGIPVIMLTGLTSEITRYAGYESGADDYVTKPASADAILSKIKQWLAKTGGTTPPSVSPGRLARSCAC